MGARMGTSGWSIWTGGTSERFTHSAENNAPVWSPDGTRIAYSSNRDSGVNNLWVKASIGTEPEAPALTSSLDKSPRSWSSDGMLAFEAVGARGDIWILPLAAGGTAIPLPADRVRRARSDILAGRAVAGVSLGRIRAERSLRAAVPERGRPMGRLDGGGTLPSGAATVASCSTRSTRKSGRPPLRQRRVACRSAFRTGCSTSASAVPVGTSRVMASVFSSGTASRIERPVG